MTAKNKANIHQIQNSSFFCELSMQFNINTNKLYDCLGYFTVFSHLNISSFAGILKKVAKIYNANAKILM